MSTPPIFMELERVVRRAPLAVRCIDFLTDKQVSDGLIVTARKIGSSAPAQTAYRSPVSGIFGFQSLEGIYPYPFKSDNEDNEDEVIKPCDESDPLHPPDVEKANFILIVQDTQGRFLPRVLKVCLPKTRVYDIDLLSAPTRPTPAGYGVMRAELWDDTAKAPAAWAFVRAVTTDLMPNGRQHVHAGQADKRGVFALFIPYPPSESAAPTAAPFADRTWAFTFEVFYRPDDQVPLIVDYADMPPDHYTIVNQKAAQFKGSGSPLPVELTERTESILSTAGEKEKRLFVIPS
jgi:hypothetical protein